VIEFVRVRVIVTPVVCALMLSAIASAQEINMSTPVASIGDGTGTAIIKVDSAKPKPATDHGLAVPSMTVFDDGSRVSLGTLIMQLPDLDVGEIAVASRLGDQPLPSVFRAAPLAGSALASSLRGFTFTSTGTTAVNLSFGQMGGASAATSGSPALAAAAVSFSPNTRLSVTPQVLIPVGSRDAQRTVETAIRANVASNLTLVTDVGVAGTNDSAWAPVASARLVSQWPRFGVETSVLRGAAAPRTETAPALVSARDREAAQAQVQLLPDLTLAAVTSASRPAGDPNASASDDTKLGSLSMAYDGLSGGRLTALRQRETTASRESDITSLEWRQSGSGRMAVRFVQRRASDSSTDGVDEASSRFELDLPALTPRCAGCLDLRAGLTAGSSSLTGPGVNSRVSGRIAVVNGTALTGETELGITGGGSQVLRTLRVTTDTPVVPATRLQLSYSYRATTQTPPLGQVFEAHIMRRLNLGW
jgi:hypothetical protein